MLWLFVTFIISIGTNNGTLARNIKNQFKKNQKECEKYTKNGETYKFPFP